MAATSQKASIGGGRGRGESGGIIAEAGEVPAYHSQLSGISYPQTRRVVTMT
jgi:hypothetical protein